MNSEYQLADAIRNVTVCSIASPTPPMANVGVRIGGDMHPFRGNCRATGDVAQTTHVHRPY